MAAETVERETAPGPRAGGMAGLAHAFRSGETTIAAVVDQYFSRISAGEADIGAFEHLAEESARSTAAALDTLLSEGTDLGPLMGMPLVIKDLFAVEGMPVRAGSDVDVASLIGPEGSFVRRLRRAGSVILGKTRTIEFALGGAGGVNQRRGTPRNPCDATVFRGCGGSSSGSAAAVAAGFSAFAVGSDTGGSVRIPAAFCGLVGLKPTTGLWPTDGVFPLSESLDTIGVLTRSVADAAFVFSALEAEPLPACRPVRSLRLGLLSDPSLDPPVAAAWGAAVAQLRAAGARIEDVELPDFGRAEDYYHAIVPAEFIASFGAARFEAVRGALGEDIAARGGAGLTLTAERYITMQRRRQDLARRAHAAIAGFDAWLSPTVDMLAPPVAAFEDVATALALNARIGRLTRAINLCDFCSLSMPLPGAALPVGLQVMAPRRQDGVLLAVGSEIERVLAAAA